jgi:phage baseplate assembly protein gpV
MAIAWIVNDATGTIYGIVRSKSLLPANKDTGVYEAYDPGNYADHYVYASTQQGGTGLRFIAFDDALLPDFCFVDWKMQVGSTAAESDVSFGVANRMQLETDFDDGGRLDLILDEAAAQATAAAADAATIKGKLPSKAYLAGTSNADGDVQLNEATGVFSIASLANAPTGTTASYTVSSATVGEAPQVNIMQYRYAAFGSIAITAATAQTDDSHAFLVYIPGKPNTVLWSLTTAGGEISVGGVGDKTITIVATDAHMGTAGKFAYVLRNTTDDAVICEGYLTIEDRPNVPST